MTADYTVVGGGAIGGTLAWHLASAGSSVVIVDRDADHVARINADGLRIQRADGSGGSVRVQASTPENFTGTIGAALLAVKAQHTATASEWIAERLSDDGWVVSMQNGLNEAAIAEKVGKERTVGAFVNLNADVLEPGVIHDGGIGALVLGELDGSSSNRTERLAADLRSWGSPLLSDSISGFLWSKLAYGAMLTITSSGNAEMPTAIRGYVALMTAVAREVCAVAVAEGHVLQRFDAFDARAFAPGMSVASSVRATEDLASWLDTLEKRHSGIWRDLVVRKRRTEVLSQYGPVLKAADENAISAPVLTASLELIRRIEVGEAVVQDSNYSELDRVAIAAGDRP